MNRSSRSYLASTVAIVALAVPGSAIASAESPVQARQASSGAVSADDARVNKSLNTMARLFAKAVTDKGIRQQIRKQAAKRFDGDTNVLYTKLKASSDIRNKLATAYIAMEAGSGRTVSRAAALSATDKMVESIPRFQVAVPARFGAWNAASYTPLVGFAPEGTDDTSRRTITAYNSKGRAHTLNARVAPKRPVIILGLNERTNAAGQVERGAVSKQTSSTVDARGALAQVRLVKAQLHDDQEPWFKGDAETMLIAKARGLWWYDEITYLDDSKDLLILNKVLGTTRRGVYFYWFEKDGSNHDVSVSVKGVSLGVKIDDSDDLIGGTFMKHSLFVGDSDNKRYFGELTQVTD